MSAHSVQPQAPHDSARATGLAAFLQGFVYAFAGVRHVLATQRNMRVHLALAVLAILAGIWLHISPVEFAIVVVTIALVLSSEMLNTVVEACVDLATQEIHPLAKIAKDVAAGAVLLNAALAVVVGLLIFGPHLLALRR
jgi:diacylglycerol kinase (ATP)